MAIEGLTVQHHPAPALTSARIDRAWVEAHLPLSREVPGHIHLASVAPRTWPALGTDGQPKERRDGAPILRSSVGGVETISIAAFLRLFGHTDGSHAALVAADRAGAKALGYGRYFDAWRTAGRIP